MVRPDPEYLIVNTTIVEVLLIARKNGVWAARTLTPRTVLAQRFGSAVIVMPVEPIMIETVRCR